MEMCAEGRIWVTHSSLYGEKPDPERDRWTRPHRSVLLTAKGLSVGGEQMSHVSLLAVNSAREIFTTKGSADFVRRQF